MASADVIVAEATAIHAAVKVAGLDYSKSNDELKRPCRALFNELMEDHRDFCTTLPIVTRWMVFTGEFRADVLRRYVNMLAATPDVWDDRDKFLESQARYLTMLYRAQHKGPVDERRLREYQARIAQSLLDEDGLFQEAKERVPEEIKKMDADADAERRRRLHEHLLRAAGRTPGDPAQASLAVKPAAFPAGRS